MKCEPNRFEFARSTAACSPTPNQPSAHPPFAVAALCTAPPRSLPSLAHKQARARAPARDQTLARSLAGASRAPSLVLVRIRSTCSVSPLPSDPKMMICASAEHREASHAAGGAASRETFAQRTPLLLAERQCRRVHCARPRARTGEGCCRRHVCRPVAPEGRAMPWGGGAVAPAGTARCSTRIRPGSCAPR